MRDRRLIVITSRPAPERRLQWTGQDIERLIPLLTACAALGACGGAEEIASPGSGGNITINNPPATPRRRLRRRRRRRRWSPRLPAARRSTTRPASRIAARSAVRPASTATASCRLRFTPRTTLTKVPGLLYSLGGRVDVGNDRGAAPTSEQARSR
jgi:hypothetical protein